MRLIRSLVLPWILYFLAAVGGLLVLGIRFPHIPVTVEPVSLPVAIMGTGAILCVMANLRTLGLVGIWMHESLPESLRYGSFRWIFRALKAIAIAAAFYFVGQFAWVPLIWQAAVIPAVFTICLFVAIWSLEGPILQFASNLAWSRAFSIILSLPILAAVPATAYFIGQNMVAAYRLSHMNLMVAATQANPTTNEPVAVRGRVLSVGENDARLYGEWPMGSGEMKTLELPLASLPAKLQASLQHELPAKEIAISVEGSAIKDAGVKSTPDKLDENDVRSRLKSGKTASRASALREIYEFAKSCDEYGKDILAALEPQGPKDVVYWGAKAVHCAGLRSPVVLPKLVQVMLEHPDAKARAAAIRAMRTTGLENVRQISYLLVKRLVDNEPPEVVDATSWLLAPLGGDHPRWATNRLKNLLDDAENSQAAAKALLRDFSREDLVAEYVAQNLAKTDASRTRAVGMICLLPESKRTLAEPHIKGILATIKTGDPNDPGLKALDCLGPAGFAAIREEVTEPRQLERPVAARALATLDVKGVPEALETANSCARDANTEVRKWCSQSLGQLGKPALPKILDLLESSDATMKDAGRNALRFFEDASAKDELRKVMQANSGWMANNRKLQIAKAVGSALSRIESTDN